jgi:hypothetical protein
VVVVAAAAVELLLRVVRAAVVAEQQRLRQVVVVPRALPVHRRNLQRKAQVSPLQTTQVSGVLMMVA